LLNPKEELKIESTRRMAVADKADSFAPNGPARAR